MIKKVKNTVPWTYVISDFKDEKIAKQRLDDTSLTGEQNILLILRN